VADWQRNRIEQVVTSGTNGRHALQQEVSVQFRLGEIRDPDDMAVHTKSSSYTLQSTMHTMQYDINIYEK
jgi:hypothetical protein